MMAQRQNPTPLLKGYPKEVILNDGTGVTRRPLGAGDEKPLFEMFKRFSEDELWFLVIMTKRLPVEWGDR